MDNLNPFFLISIYQTTFVYVLNCIAINSVRQNNLTLLFHSGQTDLTRVIVSDKNMTTTIEINYV